jgi:hypothetical protein
MNNKAKLPPAISQSDPLSGLTVSGAVLARVLGVSGKVIYELDKSGVIERATRGNYVLESSVRGYCDHIRRSLTNSKPEQN